MKKISYTIAIIFLTSFLTAQNNISVKILPFGLNLQEINSEIYTSKLTGDGLITFEPGIQFSFEIFGDPNTSVKLIQSINKDQMNHLAGFSQILIKYKLILDKKNYFSIGVGPALHYRKDWTDIAGYRDEGIYKYLNHKQYKTSWLSGEIEYNHYLRKKTDISISLNHLHPKSFGLFFGIKFWFSRKSSFCPTCPSYH